MKNILVFGLFFLVNLSDIYGLSKLSLVPGDETNILFSDLGNYRFDF